MSLGYDNSYVRSKSGYFVRQYFKGCRINWIVSEKGIFGLRYDIKVLVKCRFGDSGFQIE